MPPRRECPLPTRSARRGRGRLRQGQPDLRGEESTASPFRATLAAEPVEIPPPPTGIPAVSSEVIQAMAAFFTAMAGQAQTSQVPPVVPPVTPSVPLAHDVSISKKLKEARQLGCVSFVGELDATAAKDWINQVSETLFDMRLEDEMKLIVATRLLEKRAHQADYFEKGLRNEIRERMTVTGREPHKEPLKRSKGSFVSGSAPSVSVTSSRPSFSQMQQRPPRFSGSAVTTSEKSFGGQATVAALSSSTRTDLQMRDSSGAQLRQGVAIRPDVESGELSDTGKRLHPRTENISISTPMTGVPWASLIRGARFSIIELTSIGEARRITPEVGFEYTSRWSPCETGTQPTPRNGCVVRGEMCLCV
ncbi:Gag protease polyprotein, putative [Theobroma cacao]|uniref:Gag protease polyprotein, putative n=1 Tax=Theobroma cacao TaxID=3641 RepID=A0A061E6C4_THECC|nr:Gag protease polyprotein, putative [Theobroma cacao]